MVDVEGMKRYSLKLTDKCNCADLQVNNAEWCARESLGKILEYENIQFSFIFTRYENIKFSPTSLNIEKAINSRETFGVTTTFFGYELFECPVLVGGKMYSIIESKIDLINKTIWDSFQWQPPFCLFCKSDLIPTSFVVKGRLYTLGQLAWTNYDRVVYTKKRKGFIIYNNNLLSPITSTDFPILQDFSSMQQSLPTSIGNRKIFHGGFIFTEMLKHTLFDIEKIREYRNEELKTFATTSNKFSPKKRDVLIKQIIRTQTKRINTGAIDCVIGRNTVFNLPENDTSFPSSKNYCINNIGRYKVLNKLDYTAISKCLQIDILTTLFSRRIPIDLQRGDIGYVCLVSSSEQSPGTSSLESVLGCFVSTPKDCVSDSDIQSFFKLHFDLLPLHSALDCNLSTDIWWFVIINKSLFKHRKMNIPLSDWVIYLRSCIKNILKTCIEVYQISERLYVVYSLPLTFYKLLHDGLAYSSMEVSTTDELFVNMIAENYNLHGPTAMLIPNLNSNHLIRNTMVVHAIKNCVSGISSPLLKNETFLLNKTQLVSGVPFYCIKANILILPLAHNVEDACVISSNSSRVKKLFTVCHKITATVHLHKPFITKELITQFPTILKPNMVLFKFQSAKTFHVGKNLSIEPDIFDKNISNVVWTPNTDVIKTENVTLKNIKLSNDKSDNFYCDFEVSYLQDADLGTKLVILNGDQKTVIGKILDPDEMPLLHNSHSITDVENIDIDIIQHPYSLKRLNVNFLFSPQLKSIYNECFSITPYDRLKILSQKKDYFVSNRKTGRFYVDKDGYPVEAILYEGFAVVMGKQNPNAFRHSASIDYTPVNILTGQPEVRYQTSNFINKNNHCFGLSESEREVCVGLGLNSFLEEMHDLSDETHLTLENIEGERVCIPSSKSTARMLDMLSLAGVEVDFTIKDIETEF